MRGNSFSNSRDSVPRKRGTDGSEQSLDSDGNHVNVGNFDAKGLNVNNNWDNNRNNNLGLASARQASLSQRTPAQSGRSHYTSLVDFIQPPSMRPISSISDSSATYRLLSMAFTSLASRMKTRSMLSLVLAISKTGSFAALFVCPATMMPSSTSSRRSSLFCQRV